MAIRNRYLDPPLNKRRTFKSDFRIKCCVCRCFWSFNLWNAFLSYFWLFNKNFFSKNITNPTQNEYKSDFHQNQLNVNANRNEIWLLIYVSSRASFSSEWVGGERRISARVRLLPNRFFSFFSCWGPTWIYSQIRIPLSLKTPQLFRFCACINFILVCFCFSIFVLTRSQLLRIIFVLFSFFFRCF